MKKFITAILITALTFAFVGCNDQMQDKDAVFLKTVADATNIVASFNTKEADYAILGEPAVTSVGGKTGKVIALDLQSEWKKLYPENDFVQAGLIIKSEVANHKDVVNKLVDKLKESKTYIYDNMAILGEKFGERESTLKSMNFTVDVLDRCNIDCKDAISERQSVEYFLNALYEYDVTQIGGKMPDDGFYFDGSNAVKDNSDSDLTFKIGIVDGAPSLSVASILDGFTYYGESHTISVEVEFVTSAQAISSGLTNGTFDMAITPLNIASKLYNGTKLGVKLASVNVFGCLYMLGDEVVTDLSNLKNKTVCTVGAGGTPEIIFKHILSKNGIKVNVE